MDVYLKSIQFKISFMCTVLDLPDAALDQKDGMDNLWALYFFDSA